MGFNGWTNKETWLVNLWLGDMFQCDLEDGVEITPDYIETLVEELVHQTIGDPSGFITDLLNCALGEINYNELASMYEMESE